MINVNTISDMSYYLGEIVQIRTTNGKKRTGKWEDIVVKENGKVCGIDIEGKYYSLSKIRSFHLRQMIA